MSAEHPERERLAQIVIDALREAGCEVARVNGLPSWFVIDIADKAADRALAFLRPEAAIPDVLLWRIARELWDQDIEIERGQWQANHEAGEPAYDEPEYDLSDRAEYLPRARRIIVLVGPRPRSISSELANPQIDSTPAAVGHAIPAFGTASPPEGRELEEKMEGESVAEWLMRVTPQTMQSTAAPVDRGLVERIRAWFDGPADPLSDGNHELLSAATLLDEALAALERAPEPRAGEVVIAHRTPDSVKLIQVVEVVAARGNGTDASPVRLVAQYWSTSGELLAERDPDWRPPAPASRAPVTEE